MKYKKLMVFGIYMMFSLVLLKGQTNSFESIKDSIQNQQNQYDKIKNTLNIYFEDLKKVALDTILKLQVRREAVLLIGEIETDESIEFLIEHISFFMYSPRDGDINYYLEHPFFYALIKGKEKGNSWKLLPFVMKALSDEEKTKEELKWFSKIIKSAMYSSKELFGNFLEIHFKAALPPLKQNLSGILKQLK